MLINMCQRRVSAYRADMKIIDSTRANFMKNNMLAKFTFIITMILFGSIGPIIRQIGLPGATISYFRGAIGIPFILICMLLARKKINFRSYLRNWKPLLLSGICIGCNWIFLFESYDYTTVSMSITMNYLAPVFVILLAPFIVKEKISAVKIGCMGMALIGVLCIGNVFTGGIADQRESIGFILAFFAAITYACLIFCNKFLKDINGLDSCVAQLVISNFVILIYVLARQDITAVAGLSAYELGMLFLAGIVFTGLPYVAYFSLLMKLKCQESSLYSYMEPITAIILSALVLRESMNAYQIVGTVLILAATVSSEIFGEFRLDKHINRRNKRKSPYTADIESPIPINNETTNEENINENLDIHVEPSSK